MSAYQHLLVAIDGSAPGGAALHSAIVLAKESGARLTIVSVAEPTPTFGPDLRVAAEVRQSTLDWLGEVLARAAETARAGGVATVATLLREGPVVDTLVDVAQETHPDLYVLGARGLSRARRILLGSVSDAVLHQAPCSVLIVRAPAPA